MQIGRNSSILVTLTLTLTTSTLSACNELEKEMVKLAPKDITVEVNAPPTSDAPQKLVSFVTVEGLQGVHFGVTEQEARSTFVGGFEDIDREYEEECYYLSPKNTESQVYFMVLNGTIQRIDIFTPRISTKLGAKVGMSFKAVEALYLDFHRKPNFYTYPDEDLIVQLDKNTQAIFEQSQNEIISNYRIGKIPAVGFAEGCL